MKLNGIENLQFPEKIELLFTLFPKEYQSFNLWMHAKCKEIVSTDKESIYNHWHNIAISVVEFVETAVFFSNQLNKITGTVPLKNFIKMFSSNSSKIILPVFLNDYSLQHRSGFSFRHCVMMLFNNNQISLHLANTIQNAVIQDLYYFIYETAHSILGEKDKVYIELEKSDLTHVLYKLSVRHDSIIGISVERNKILLHYAAKGYIPLESFPEITLQSQITLLSILYAEWLQCLTNKSKYGD